MRSGRHPRCAARLGGVFGLCALVVLVTTLVLPQAVARADTVRDQQWWAKSLRLGEVHAITQGEGIKVAVVDTGVDPMHPDLAGSVLPGWDATNGAGNGQDDTNGHGTAVASVIAGHGHGPGGSSGLIGVAPKAKIIPIKIFRDKKLTEVRAAAVGIDAAIKLGADVINVSTSMGNARDSEIDGMVRRAFEKGIPVIAAAGNTSNGNAMVGEPGSSPHAIAITGIDRNDQHDPDAVVGDRVALSAPSGGYPVAFNDGGYALVRGGTSTSTAIVSGAAALIKARYPKLGTDGIYRRLIETSRSLGGDVMTFGWGALDIYKALTGTPDGRMNSQAAALASESASVAAIRSMAANGVGGGNDSSDDGAGITPLLLVGGVVGALVVTVVVVGLAMRRRRRRADTAAPAGAGFGPGPPAASGELVFGPDGPPLRFDGLGPPSRPGGPPPPPPANPWAADPPGPSSGPPGPSSGPPGPSSGSPGPSSGSPGSSSAGSS